VPLSCFLTYCCIRFLLFQEQYICTFTFLMGSFEKYVAWEQSSCIISSVIHWIVHKLNLMFIRPLDDQILSKFCVR
jgi:hypothetical protein